MRLPTQDAVRQKMKESGLIEGLAGESRPTKGRDRSKLTDESLLTHYSRALWGCIKCCVVGLTGF